MKFDNYYILCTDQKKKKKKKNTKKKNTKKKIQNNYIKVWSTLFKNGNSLYEQ